MTEGTGSPAALRAGNRARVIGVLREHGEMTQAALARATGLSPATVSNIVRELRSAGCVDAVRGSAGRRGVPVALRRTAGFAVGIDFGHRHLRVLVADLAHPVVAEASRELPVAHTATEGIGQAADMVRSALAEAGAEADAVVGVAMGLPGPVDRRTGAVTSAASPPGWVGVPAAEQMGAELGLPVRVDNDANLGALAEVMWGAGQDCVDLVYLKVATGVRSGFVLGGPIYRGAFGTASEIGHTTIDEIGPVCRCGNRGLEMYAGGGALAALLHRPKPALGPRGLVELAEQGGLGCRRVIADAGRVLGLFVANLCTLICPERVVVGGPLAAAGDLLLDPLRASLHRVAVHPIAGRAVVVRGVLGERAQVLGAVALVLRECESFAQIGATADTGGAAPAPVLADTGAARC